MRFIFSLLLFTFLGFQVSAQSVQIATFKDTKSLFAKEGKAYTVKFQLSTFPSDEVRDAFVAYASSNNITSRFSPNKKGGANVFLLFPENLANGPVLGKMLMQLGVVEVIVQSKGDSKSSVEEFIKTI
ncbi:MAG: hypothetical protein ACK40M_08730 [Flavobacteriales bacterium]